MNVLVIGGTGFLSGRVADLLIERGHDVAILTRGRTDRVFSGSVEHLKGDRNSAESLRAAVGGRTFDAVVDMIAYGAEDTRAATEALFDRTDRWIHCSTISVYMVSHEPTCPITEDQDRLPLMPHWPRNPFGMDYGVKKRQAEEVLRAAYEAGGPNVTVLRPTFVSGPRDKTARDFFWIQRILDGRPLLVPGSGDHAFQQVYVDDAAAAFAAAVETNPPAWAYNVVGEDVFSLNEYLARVGGLLQREPTIVNIDQDAFDRFSMSTNPNGDVFPFNTRRTSVFSLQITKRDLGYRSTPFDRWMHSTIDWYMNHFDGDSLGYDRREEEVRLAEAVQERHRQLAAFAEGWD